MVLTIEYLKNSLLSVSTYSYLNVPFPMLFFSSSWKEANVTPVFRKTTHQIYPLQSHISFKYDKKCYESG